MSKRLTFAQIVKRRDIRWRRWGLVCYNGCDPAYLQETFDSRSEARRFLYNSHRHPGKWRVVKLSVSIAP